MGLTGAGAGVQAFGAGTLASTRTGMTIIGRLPPSLIWKETPKVALRDRRRLGVNDGRDAGGPDVMSTRSVRDEEGNVPERSAGRSPRCGARTDIAWTCLRRPLGSNTIHPGLGPPDRLGSTSVHQPSRYDHERPFTSAFPWWASATRSRPRVARG